ncbi:type II toxin-antitoxin system RelE/ParE family toxin [Chryseobacterium sp. YIM B08800]|uniref:type II toxin-antitoxin system RelE/ParE family toxin n=1 Tax=Chryseobacterium sp. YIM B08800 TaxID=2984136 RepID=UPI00223F62EE|nr:type II toxin-antitoxin system RelE/ParE family toxin [Chryseobacterium sp. YIM B08800]
MAFEIEYTHHAEIDVNKAIDYYAENVSLKVAKSFYKKLLAAEKTLKRTPFFQKIHNDFHRLPLKIFPFIIIYKIEKETIKIFRVFHTSQNPEKYP